MDVLKCLNETTTFLKSKSSLQPKLGFVLGSGLAALADAVQVTMEIPYGEIPHFAPPTVAGHPGRLIFGELEGVSVAVLQGRNHAYEGHPWSQVVYPVRALAHFGVKTLVVTNAAGGLNPKMKPGDFMVIKDHINLTGDNPLRGPNISELGPRFVDMTEPYNKKLTALLVSVLKAQKIRHSVGVYCGVMGPTYETAAEIQFYRKIGGGAVGMSTVAEVIAARHMGIDVVGLSCITNLGTGLTKQRLSHKEVQEVAQKVEDRFVRGLKAFTKKLKPLL